MQPRTPPAGIRPPIGSWKFVLAQLVPAHFLVVVSFSWRWGWGMCWYVMVYTATTCPITGDSTYHCMLAPLFMLSHALTNFPVDGYVLAPNCSYVSAMVPAGPPYISLHPLRSIPTSPWLCACQPLVSILTSISDKPQTFYQVPPETIGYIFSPGFLGPDFYSSCYASNDLFFVSRTSIWTFFGMDGWIDPGWIFHSVMR